VATAPAIQPAGSIVGHVVDTLGLPLPRVSVTLTPERGGGSRRTSTDGNGVYRFEALPAAYRVDFELQGFIRVHWHHVSVRPSDTGTVDAVLSIRPLCECVTRGFVTAPTPLSGQVVDQDGQPLPYARVEITGARGAEDAYTDDEGRFLVRVPVDGTWAITASYSGFDAVRQELRNVAGEPLVLKLRYIGESGPMREERLGGCLCPELFVLKRP
jgi:hypothetical protein